MSASTDRKMRQDAIASGVDRKTLAAMEEEKKRKKSKAKWTFGSIVVVLLIAAILILNSNIFYTRAAAVTIGDEDYTTAQFEYYFKNQYFGFVTQYGDYISMFGLNTQQPLKSQDCPMLEDGTWFDYFKEQAITGMTQITALSDYAKENGLELTDEDYAEIDAQIDSYRNNEEAANYKTLDKYLAAIYGRGFTEEVLRGELERSVLAQKAYDSVSDSYTFTDGELETWYQEHKDEYDMFDYDYYLVSAEKVEAPAESEDAEPTTAVTDETMAAAKLTADAIAAAAKNGTLNEAVAANVADAAANEQTNAMGSNITDDYAQWLKDSARVKGDVTVIESADTGYYVVVFNGRNNNHYNLQMARHILIKAVEGEDGTYTDEAKATAKAEAERLMAEWKAGDATEESFASMAGQYSEDPGSKENGGLYDAIANGQMVAEFNDFVYDPARKTGDVSVVYGESQNYAGYHVVYYVGQSDVVYSDYIAENVMRDEKMTAWQEELVANYTSSTHFALRYAT